jgi:serine protease inhibitor
MIRNGSRSIFNRAAVKNRVTVTLVLFALLGCSSVSHSSGGGNTNSSANSNTAMENEPQQSTPAQVSPELASASARFGFKLYSQVLKQDAGANLFISPASVGLCLAMAYNGAQGDTRQAMARALEVQGMSLEELNRAYSQLKAALASADPKVQLEVANSLWGRQGVSFRQDFIQRNKQFFGAEVTALNFGDPGAPAKINSWVSDKTHGKITEIVDSISPDSILFLINAIYFKGQWSKQFDPAKTKEESFNTAGGAAKRLPMMTQSGKYQYLESPEFQAVSLPYGGGRVSMYVFLPAEGKTLNNLHRELTAANWEKWMGEFAENEGSISLPRFKLEYEITLNDALKALGMGPAFEAGQADFSGMVEGGTRVYISKVKHKTFAEVNEEGTEAAAVTSTEMRATSAMRPRQPFRMVVDRPFFFAIRDNDTGAVLFMGSILNP